jgi:catechol 2,3-dioxygenase-like lactoylglutathione lyase family enzyme
MDESPTLDQINLIVSDMEATVTFYRRLGLEIPDTDAAFQGHHRSARLPGGIDLDFDSAEFARHWDVGRRSGRAVLGFRVSSRERVDAIYSQLTAFGHVGEQPPYDAFWGSRYAIVQDPDGNPVGVMSPADPDRRSRPSFP